MTDEGTEREPMDRRPYYCFSVDMPVGNAVDRFREKFGGAEPEREPFIEKGLLRVGPIPEEDD